MSLDRDWALNELAAFVNFTQRQRASDPAGIRSFPPRTTTHGSQADIAALAQVVEQIFDRVLPGWRTDLRPNPTNKWSQHVEAANRARTVLLRQAEIEEKLGDNAPRLNAAHLHPWAWDGARSLWQSGHYREAVRAACVKINAETQNKLGRLDISETDLFNHAFSLGPPQPGKPRLRLMSDDGSPTFKNLHRGVRSFAEGCYAAIRNPISHTEGDLTEDEALEQLAALSVLARWVDTATLEQ
jgi:hypothetical protein